MLCLNLVRHDVHSSWILPIFHVLPDDSSVTHVFDQLALVIGLWQIVVLGLVHGWFLCFVFWFASMVCHSAEWVLVMLYESPRR